MSAAPSASSSPSSLSLSLLVVGRASCNPKEIPERGVTPFPLPSQKNEGEKSLLLIPTRHDYKKIPKTLVPFLPDGCIESCWTQKNNHEKKETLQTSPLRIEERKECKGPLPTATKVRGSRTPFYFYTQNNVFNRCHPHSSPRHTNQMTIKTLRRMRSSQTDQTAPRPFLEVEKDRLGGFKKKTQNWLLWCRTKMPSKKYTGELSPQ